MKARVSAARATGGKYDHLSVAVLTKDATGELEVERHDAALAAARRETQAATQERTEALVVADKDRDLRI